VGIFLLTGKIEAEGRFDLKQDMVGPTFGLETPGPLERNVAELYSSLLKTCESSAPWKNDYCFLVDVIHDFLETGRSLKQEAVSNSNLPLTLASGMHPLSLDRNFFSSADSLDVTYARFLLAQTLLVELWPHAPEDMRSSGYKRTMAWMTSFSSFSYLFRLSQLQSCLDSKEKGCQLKKDAIFILKSVFAALEQDQEFTDRLQATHDYLKEINFSSRRISLHQGLLASVTDLSQGNLISFFSSPSAPNARMDSIETYFDHLKHDSEIHFTHRYEFTGQACADLNGTLQFLKDLRVEGFESVEGEMTCEVKGGYLSVVSGLAFDQIMERGLLWRFTFFQLRLMIAQITDYIDPLEEGVIRQLYYQSLLDDIHRIKQAVAHYPDSGLRSSGLKADQRVLWESMLDIFDASKDLEEGLQ